MLDISQGGRWSGGRWHGYDDGSLQKRLVVLDRGSRVPVSSVSVNDDSSDTLEPGPYTPRWRAPLPSERGLGHMANHPTPCATPGDHSSAPLSMGTKGPSLERVSAAIGEVPGAHNLWAGVPVGAGVWVVLARCACWWDPVATTRWGSCCQGLGGSGRLRRRPARGRWAL